ncbi:MAG: site-specific DNA-methyltransferase [Gaiella sp.]|nr:site-specific DNA-methyltransferase [Gaiella sp.]
MPWIAGYSSAFVQDAFDHYLPDVDDATILDPFAGVGTTLIEAQLRGWSAIGFDINPYAAMACRAKLSAAGIEPDELADLITEYQATAGDQETLIDTGALNGCRPTSTAPAGFKTRIDFYSPRVMQKVLFTRDFIDSVENSALRDLMNLAFASVMVSFSNYSYEPSLGSRPGAGKPLIEDASVVEILSSKLQLMLDDVEWLRGRESGSDEWAVYEQSFLEPECPVHANSVDLIVTSPPYLNNYHYVRNTRPQMYWLGFATSPAQLRSLEETNFGKFWQTVREQEPIRLDFEHSQLAAQIEIIRGLRVEKGIYGGNGWANYAATYYNDTFRFVSRIHDVLVPGGAAIIVVGNSLLQGVELKVEQHLGEIGEMCGLVCEDVHIVRQKRVGSSIVNTGAREAAGSKVMLYDAATVLRKPK